MTTKDMESVMDEAGCINPAQYQAKKNEIACLMATARRIWSERANQELIKLIAEMKNEQQRERLEAKQ